jgi:hypothetical protein
MTTMRRRSPSALALAALAAGVGLAMAAACTLYSNGESTAGGDGGMTPSDATLPDTSPPPHEDAGQDAPSPGSDAGPKDSGADACEPIETNCLDGIDNNCNGLTDCADPACTAGFECVPAAAGGWSGYAIYDDTRTTACPSTYPTQDDTFEGLISSPATCSSCVCTASGTTCGASSLRCEDDGGPCTASTPVASLSASCTALGPGVTTDGRATCAASAPAATGGSCAASGGAATLPPVSFSKLSRTCTATSGPGAGCAAGNVCVAKAPAGSHGVCVTEATSGTAICPGGYSHAFVVLPTATSFDDTRSCTACACGGLTGASCTAAMATLFLSSDCEDGGGPGSVSLPADGNCHPIGGAAATFASGSLTTTTNQGSCPPSGGAPTGSVTAENPTAYCCQN